jgi:hypothetical protein
VSLPLGKEPGVDAVLCKREGVLAVVDRVGRNAKFVAAPRKVKDAHLVIIVALHRDGLVGSRKDIAEEEKLEFSWQR